MSVCFPHSLLPILTTSGRLWEPGYRERYYEQKFGVPYTDMEFRRKYVGLTRGVWRWTDVFPRITTHYVEGLAWVLYYYYQGVSL